MLTKLKKRVQQALTFEADFAIRIGLTPNMISLVGFIIAFVSASIFTIANNQTHYLFLATFLLLTSGFFDLLDGVVARKHNKTSVFGGFLDSILDRSSDATVFAGIILGGLCEPIWGLIALAGSFLVSYSRARAEAAGIVMEAVGVAERAERILMLSGGALLTIFWSEALNYTMIILALLTTITVLQRMVFAYRSLKKNGNV